jgi:hypothetical protein
VVGCIIENFGYFYNCRGYGCLLHNSENHCNPRTCLYDEFTIVHTISSLTLYKVASENIGPFCTSFATIRADGDGVTISFPLGSDGLASISTVYLGLRFQLNIASLYIDEKVFDSVSGVVTYTIG